MMKFMTYADDECTGYHLNEQKSQSTDCPSTNSLNPVFSLFGPKYSQDEVQRGSLSNN